jgi:uncharacterized protein YbjT (DUF2867 family)
MEAWVAGATGLVGRLLVGELTSRPEVANVTALVRKAEGRVLAKLEEQVVEFEKIELELAGRTATHVFCCLGTTIAKAGSEAAFRQVDHEYPLALGRAAVSARAKKFFVVTALGADPSSRIFYNRVKGELERDLAGLGLPELHVFRPSLILGDRADRRVLEKITMGAARPLGPLFVGPLRRYRPIEATHVARAMVNVALGRGRSDRVNVYESDELAKLGRAGTEP